MAFRFRKSIKLLPGIRLNLNKGSASVTLGGLGFHYTLGTKGHRATVGIAGTGISWSTYQAHAATARLPAPAPSQSFYEASAEPELSPIENADVATIGAHSTNELVPILNRVRSRLRFAPFVQLACVLMFAAACVDANQLWIGVAALTSAVFVPVALHVDRYRKSVLVKYEDSGAIGQIAAVIAVAFEDLRASNCVWRIQAEGSLFDLKRNAGASTQVQRKLISLQAGRLDCIRSRSTFPVVRLGPEDIYLFADAILIVTPTSIATIGYHQLVVEFSRARFIEEGVVPADAIVVGQTWKYLNKKGGPDRRFVGNRQLPICSYGELTLRSASGLNTKLQFSKSDAVCRLLRVLEVLQKTTGQFPASIRYVALPKRWPLFCLLATFVFVAALQLFPLSQSLASKGWLLSSPSKSLATNSTAIDAAGPPNMTESREATGAVPRATIVAIDVPRIFDKPYVSGSANLPNGTKLIVNLKMPGVDCRSNCRVAQLQTVVQNGRFIAGPFSGLSGRYELELLAVANAQPPDVQRVIGRSGENLIGPLVKPQTVTGTGAVVEYAGSVTFGPMRLTPDLPTKK